MIKGRDLTKEGDELAKRVGERTRDLEAKFGINQNAEVPPASVSGAAELRPTRVTSNVPPPVASQTTVNITVTDATTGRIAVAPGKTSSTAAVVITP